MHIRRDSKKSIFTKTIGIDPIDLLYIDQVKGKKSKAGKLKEIIEFFRERQK